MVSLSAQILKDVVVQVDVVDLKVPYNSCRKHKGTSHDPSVSLNVIKSKCLFPINFSSVAAELTKGFQFSF